MYLEEGNYFSDEEFVAVKIGSFARLYR